MLHYRDGVHKSILISRVARWGGGGADIHSGRCHYLAYKSYNMDICKLLSFFESSKQAYNVYIILRKEQTITYFSNL